MEPQMVSKVARLLHLNYNKQTVGKAPKWKETAPETRKVWMKLARLALREGARQSTEGSTASS